MNTEEKIAVLTSGGMDSSILLWDLAQESEVFPLYIEKGLTWEATELRFLSQFIEAVANPNVHSPTILPIPVKAIYGDHWSVNGLAIPDSQTFDESVFLPGRNVLLLGLAAIWCYTNSVNKIAIGSLFANPFPDATPEFFEDYSDLLSKALNFKIAITAPYRGQLKERLIYQFQHLPLQLTLTCISPKFGIHCGNCNKCNERRLAFQSSGCEDVTTYFSPS